MGLQMQENFVYTVYHLRPWSAFNISAFPFKDVSENAYAEPIHGAISLTYWNICASMHFRSPLPLPFSFLGCSSQAHLRHPPPKPTLVFGMHCTFAKPSHERQHSRVPPVSAITPQVNLPSSIVPSSAVSNTDDPQPNGSM